MGDGRKRTWFQSLQYENNTNALTGGRTDGLNADVVACEQALCLGKNSEEREGKGGGRESL